MSIIIFCVPVYHFVANKIAAEGPIAAPQFGPPAPKLRSSSNLHMTSLYAAVMFIETLDVAFYEACSDLFLPVLLSGEKKHAQEVEFQAN